MTHLQKSDSDSAERTRESPPRDQVRRDMLIVWGAIIAVALIILLITLVTLRPDILDPLANAMGES